MIDDGTRWWDDRKCRDVDPEVFDRPRQYPRKMMMSARGMVSRPIGKHKQVDPWADARKICSGCPVKEQCLEFVLQEEPLGKGYIHSAFAAGLTPEQIDALRARRTRRSSAR